MEIDDNESDEIVNIDEGELCFNNGFVSLRL